MNQTADPAQYVSRFINQTSKNVFLTGKAGTGKTTLLRNIVSTTYKKCLIAAPTGIAAINAGGITIHSLFQLPFGGFIPVKETQTLHYNTRLNDPVSVIKNLQMYDSKRKLLRELELLIIDEVSMLRADLLDAIDLVLRHVRRNNFPFGGVQILFIGDMLQLPPVVKEDEWRVLSNYYNSAYFFDAVVLQKNKPVYIELDKIYRQTDERFVNLLNHLRNNEMNKEDHDLVNTFYKPGYKHDPSDGYITLTTHNYKAQELNRKFLDKLSGKSYFFDAKIQDDFNENSFPLEKTLELKIGAQVMFVKNDPTGNQKFFNGKIGFVASVKDDDIEVKFDDGSNPVVVSRYEWKNVKFRVNANNEIEENIAGTFSHYPLKLAWAITVHKSQGLTFDKAIIDIGDAFAPGQVYVALSRLRSLDGLILTSSINPGSIQLDGKISTYSKSRAEQQDLNAMLTDETYSFINNYVSKSFDMSQLVRALEEHTDSYVKKDEARSVKQRHHEWAKELEKEVKEVKPHADRFRQQIHSIIAAREEDHMEFLHKRVMAAADYFSPLFKAFSNKIFRHAEIMKKEKKIKTYMSELIELEALINEQNKLIKKAGLLIRSMIEKKEVTPQDIKELLKDAGRDEQLIQLFSRSASLSEVNEPVVKQKREKKPRKEKAAKTEKKDTKEETFKLYSEGNTIEAIATARGMAITTIEGHLAHYITKGKIDPAAFIPEDKKKEIITVSKTLNTLQLGPIKQHLGDEYSYSDIRFAIAAHLATLKEE